MTSGASARAAPASLWRHPDFLKLWTAQTVSQFGDEVTQLALPFVAIATLDAGPLEMGLLATFQFLPFILLTLPAGVWVDRMRRRPILIGADIGRAILLVSIPVAFIMGWLTMTQLFVIAFLVGCLEVFFDVAHDAYLPSIVERNQLPEGNAKFEISNSAATIAGPGIAGFLVAVVTAPFAIFFDAISYLAATVFVFLVRRHEPAPERTPRADPAVLGRRQRPGAEMRRDIAEGLRYVLGHRYLRSIAACTGTFNLFFNMGGAVMLLYIVQQLGLTPATIGLIFSIGNVGVLLGALSTGRIARRVGVGPAIIGSVAIGSPALLMIPLAPPDLAVPVLVASGVLVGWSTVVYNVNQRSLRQAITPDRMLGRMTATMRFIVWGTIPIGALAGGFLGELIGLRTTLIVAGLGVLVAFLPVLFSPVRGLRQMPEAVTE
ncbi:MAG: MFS transporter [Candidatus Limnocylindria bacterium]